jgi:hypothetical protein
MRGALEPVIRRHFSIFSLPLFRPLLTRRKTLHIYTSYPMNAPIRGLLCNVMVPAQEHTTQHVRRTSCNAEVWGVSPLCSNASYNLSIHI